MLTIAMRVIGQRLYDLAVARPSASARSDDTCELFLKRRQLLDTEINFGQVTTRDPVSIVARALRMIRQIEERPDVVEFKPERASVTNEG